MLLFAVLTSRAATADAPVFTFSLGITREQAWHCNYDWSCGCWNGNRPAPWMRVDAASDGSVTKQGNVPFDIQLTFEPNIVRWILTPAVSSIADGLGCTDNCCGGGYHTWVSPPPSVSCGTPMYPPFAFYSWSGCRTDQYSAAPSSAVIAEGIPNPMSCGGYPEIVLAGCQSGEVRYTFCREDFDASGIIDGGDLGTLLAWWGFAHIDFVARLDLDDDGTISGADLGILLSRWGECAVPNG